jgi:glutamine synthetase
MTEVLNANGTPHESNGRATIADDDEDFWFGFEQEYFLWCTKNNNPPGFPAGGYPAPQGPYYCSVGADNAHGRACVEEHLDACLEAGLNVEGINAEVAAGQWEYQIFAKGAKRAGDEIWLARYLLERIGEKYGYSIELHPKPLGDACQLLQRPDAILRRQGRVHQDLRGLRRRDRPAHQRVRGR